MIEIKRKLGLAEGSQQYVDGHRGLLTPSPTLQVSYVIPIRGETTNGNFFHQVKDFARQDGIPMANFDVIYIRNNTSEDKDTNNALYESNKTVLDSILYIQGAHCQAPNDLLAWQKDVLAIARRNGLQIHTLEADPKLSKPDDTFKNIERARVYGENLAVNRFRAMKVDGAIVMLDADARIGWMTTTQIVEQLQSQPHVGMLNILYDRNHGESRQELFELTPAFRFQNNLNALHSTLVDRNYTWWYAIKADSLGRRNELSANAVDRDKLEPKKGRLVVADGISIYTQEREQQDGVGGSFSVGQYKGNGSLSYKINSTYPHPVFEWTVDFYKHNLSSLRQQNPNVNKTIASLLRGLFPGEAWISNVEQAMREGQRFEQFFRPSANTTNLSPNEYAQAIKTVVGAFVTHSQFDFEHFLNERLHRERLKHAMGIGQVKQVLDNIFQVPKGRIIRINDILVNPAASHQATFLHTHTWLYLVIQRVHALSDTPEDAFTDLQQQFPEYLNPFDATEFTAGNALLLGLKDFLTHVRRYPHRHPDIVPLLAYK